MDLTALASISFVVLPGIPLARPSVEAVAGNSQSSQLHGLHWQVIWHEGMGSTCNQEVQNALLDALPAMLGREGRAA